jgi:hypothetical protein
MPLPVAATIAEPIGHDLFSLVARLCEATSEPEIEPRAGCAGATTLRAPEHVRSILGAFQVLLGCRLGVCPVYVTFSAF